MVMIFKVQRMAQQINDYSLLLAHYAITCFACLYSEANLQLLTGSTADL